MLGLDLFGLRGVAIAGPAFDVEGLEVRLAVVLENEQLSGGEGLVNHIAFEIFVEQLVEMAQLRDPSDYYSAEEGAKR